MTSADTAPPPSVHDAALDEYRRREAAALAMGGAAKLARRKEKGVLNARERIAYLCDAGSFIESGLFGTSSSNWSDQDKTPADGKIAGFGRIDARDVGLVVNDFTVMGASSSTTNGRKIGHMKEVATRRGLPLVFLGESSGARLPDTMGSRGMGALLGNDATQYQRTRETPWASATLGYSYGSSSWYGVLSDFCVIRKGAVLAVSSALLTSLATKEEVDPETLGGWRVHAEITGFADLVVDTDEQALDAIRTFLSYLPSHHNELPPVRPVPEGSGADMATIVRHLPERRTQVYDVRHIVRTVVDAGSFFELKARFGKVAVTGLARLDGRTVGIVANNPIVKGGALDTDACEKITSFLVLCDSFNIPVVTFVDTPGFVIGADAERRRAPGKIMNMMNALQLMTVPKISVILRKSYGQAYLNMGGGKNSDEVAAWPTAEVSFMEPRFAVKVVHGLEPGDAGFDEALEAMNRGNTIWDAASMYAVQSVIEPAATRDYLIRMLDVHRSRRSGGIGAHRLANWPTSF
ncbi:acyl-CoA carboxylase subunit beta [Piscinibacter koreensis]|uniref:Methylmalonyl-CoA carboxyltransferase n=1 Tax=Piscinibacter koreensis TaxID=2742824 RepID=A0A7Y6NK95_9BURK|nr:carboxyl transferase domain-containing protein [Schlegelella koreensis]NUZ04695.1 methylmalonyl-CoA carboxyltransferase [Schlegelella koreensis]